jgi:hypothetical protein
MRVLRRAPLPVTGLDALLDAKSATASALRARLQPSTAPDRSEYYRWDHVRESYLFDLWFRKPAPERYVDDSSYSVLHFIAWFCTVFGT